MRIDAFSKSERTNYAHRYTEGAPWEFCPVANSSKVTDPIAVRMAYRRARKGGLSVRDTRAIVSHIIWSCGGMK